MFDFTKLPNKLLYVKEGKSLINELHNDKIILVLDYLYCSVNRKDIIKFSIEDMVVNCGFIPDNHKNKINEQFRNMLLKLQELKFITILTKDKEGISINLKLIKPKEWIYCTLDIDLSSNYFELHDKEKDKILTYNKEKINNLKLLIYYCYLNARMYKRAKADGDLVIRGGRAETCNPSYKLICSDLGLVDETIKKYNDILVNLNLIRIGSAGNYYYKDDTMKMLRESCNIYSLYIGNEETTQNNLKEGIKGYKRLDVNKNKVFTGSKQYKNNNRQLNGKLGAIIKKEKNGTATIEDLEMKDKILTATNPHEELNKLVSILDANKDMTLYNIYSDVYWIEDKADYYLHIEESLGLYDDNDDLKVDWDYYKWIMINYIHGEYKGDIKYFKNCIKNKLNENNTKRIGLQKSIHN